MNIVSLTDLRANMASHFDKVEADRSELVVTRQNHEPLVVIPLSDFESMKETLYLLGNKANADILMKSIAQANAGEVVEYTLVDP